LFIPVDGTAYHRLVPPHSSQRTTDSRNLLQYVKLSMDQRARRAEEELMRTRNALEVISEPSAHRPIVTPTHCDLFLPSVDGEAEGERRLEKGVFKLSLHLSLSLWKCIRIHKREAVQYQATPIKLIFYFYIPLSNHLNHLNHLNHSIFRIF